MYQYNTIQFNSGLPLGEPVVDWTFVELAPNAELLGLLLFRQQFVWNATEQIDIDRHLKLWNQGVDNKMFKNRRTTPWFIVFYEVDSKSTDASFVEKDFCLRFAHVELQTVCYQRHYVIVKENRKTIKNLYKSGISKYFTVQWKR